MAQPTGLSALKEGSAWRGLSAFLRKRRLRFAARHPAIPYKRWLAFGLPAIAATSLLLDQPVTLLMRHEPEMLRSLAAATTDIGLSGWSLSVSALAVGTGLAVTHLAWRRRLRLDGLRLALTGWFVFVSVAGSGILSNLMKQAIGRARPEKFDQLGPWSLHPFAPGHYSFESFPSGHATTDGALAMALALLVPDFRKPILALGALAAFTRVMVGAHYPSDVVAGFLFGCWFSLFSAILLARAGLLFVGGKPGDPAIDPPFQA